MLTNGGLLINYYWLRSFLRFYRAPLVMGHSNFFRFVPMKKSVATLEEGAGGRWTLWKGGEGRIRHTAFAFISGKMALAKVNYIYGTTLVPVKKRLFADQHHIIISMAQVSNPSRV